MYKPNEISACCWKSTDRDAVADTEKKEKGKARSKLTT